MKAQFEEACKLTAADGIRATLLIGGRFGGASGLAGSHYEVIRMLNQFVGQVRAGQK